MKSIYKNLSGDIKIYKFLFLVKKLEVILNIRRNKFIDLSL